MKMSSMKHDWHIPHIKICVKNDEISQYMLQMVNTQPLLQATATTTAL
jgi:hypothetical protein